MKEYISELASLAERLQRVPRRARELLTIIVIRGKSGRWGSSDNIVALHPDVAEACQMDDITIDRYLVILDEHNFASVHYDEETNRLEITTSELPWPIWLALKEFCKETQTNIREIVVEGRFNLLDE